MKQRENDYGELVNIGLSNDEAKIYSLLLSRGAMHASAISRTTSISRVMVYRTLDQLIQKELVNKIDKTGAISQFSPRHPFGLSRLVEQQKKSVEHKEKALEGIIAALSTDYVRLTGEPGVRVLVGMSGYVEGLKDIEKTKNEVCLIRTARDQDSPEIITKIREHVSRRSANGIRTRIIAPFLDSYDCRILAQDKERLVERRFIATEELQTAAQVTIYDDKVAMVSYQAESPIVTIIQDMDISSTHRSVFEYMWAQSADFTAHAMKELAQRHQVKK